MYSYEGRHYWTKSRIRFSDIQGSQDREYSDGQRALLGRKDCECFFKYLAVRKSRQYVLYHSGTDLYIFIQIDPKRAIPRDEQEKTSKIFVGGVSQEASETDFREYFMQFGRVLDATLMMDKDTGRPRGFGFVTFDSESAVENALNHPNLEIMGKAVYPPVTVYIGLLMTYLLIILRLRLKKLNLEAILATAMLPVVTLMTEMIPVEGLTGTIAVDSSEMVLQQVALVVQDLVNKGPMVLWSLGKRDRVFTTA